MLFICFYTGPLGAHPSLFPRATFGESADEATDEMLRQYGAGILENCVVRAATPEEIADRAEESSYLRP